MGLRAAMEADPKVIIMGEDVGKLGGVFRVTDGLQKDFGEDRVIDTPLAESGILGTAVGLAMRGYRPVCEIQFDGFVYPAYDQIVSQVAKMHYRSRGSLTMPIVIRIPFGGGIGAVEHHSESPEAYFAHTAGLKVVACSNPVDAYWMIQQAITADDPIVFFEPKRRYWEKGELDGRCTPDPLFTSRVVRAGTDVTVLAYGPMVKTASRRRSPPTTRARASRSSTCARCRRSTWRRCTTRCARPAASSSCTRHRSTSASAPRSPPGSPRSASTRSRHRCCASAGSTRPTRRAGSRRSTSPTSTGCSTPSTARSPTDRLIRNGLRMSDVKQFKLPDVGEGLTEAEIVTWKVKVGDTVKVNDVIVEIETAKSLVELPCPYAGTVIELLAAEGDTVNVGSPIIAVETGDAGAAPAAPPAPATPEVGAPPRTWSRHPRPTSPSSPA